MEIAGFKARSEKSCVTCGRLSVFLLSMKEQSSKIENKLILLSSGKCVSERKVQVVNKVQNNFSNSKDFVERQNF